MTMHQVSQVRSFQPNLLRQALAACLPAFAWVGLFSLCVNLLMLTVPLYMMQVFDRVLTSRSIDTLLLLTVVGIGALVTLALLDLARTRILIALGSWLDRRLGPEAFARAITAALRGRAYRTEALRDLEQLRAFVGGPAVLALLDAPWVPVYVAVSALLHPVIGMAALGGCVLLFALALLNEACTRVPLQDASNLSLRSMQQAESITRNAEIIDAMGMLPGLAGRWLAGSGEGLRRQTVAGNRAAAVLALSKFARLAIQVAALGVGAWLAVQQELTAGAMVAGSIILSRALAPVEQAIGIARQFSAARTALRRLRPYFAEAPLRPPAMALPAPCGHLSVERLMYAPPGSDRPVLKGISFALPASEALAVIGPSAAGKSTLARLLVGTLAPSVGHVRLDGAEVFAWERSDFGRHVGYLPQDVELFAGSVRDNIARMQADAAPEDVVAAARMADVHDMILRLPRGYDTDIGEAGALLSGGQRQRIGLARALYGNPRLVVLDEPNANLDGAGESALVRALEALRGNGATVVLITHRPSFLAAVDKVLLLRDGTIELFGPRDKVLEQMRMGNVVPRAKPPIVGLAKPQEVRP
jgi:ATP-binding cassette, subfamily C, type I secretion system permease/ATPase